jgi:hypothetical protein
MAINIHNLRVYNMTVGAGSSGGEGGGGGGSSEPSYLAVGAYKHNYGVGGNDTGRVYVYDMNNLSASPTAFAPYDSATDIKLGYGLDISSKYMAVGAYSANSNSGTAWIYDTTNLSAAPTEITPSDLVGSDFFGYRTKIIDDLIVVSAFNQNNSGGNWAGAVYVYDGTNLSASPTKLSGKAASQSFGEYFAANSSQLVIGTRQDKAYVYDTSNLSTSPTVISAPSNGDNFGWTMDASDTHIVIGAKYDDNVTSNAGAVYVYDATNLSASPTRLAPSGLDTNDDFGETIAVSDSYIAVGAQQDDDQGSNAGAVYVYDATNLSATPTKLAPSGLDASDFFGHKVEIMGSKLVVGAYLDDDQASGAGAVYVYDLTNLSAAPTKLTASDGLANSYFGSTIALG